MLNHDCMFVQRHASPPPKRFLCGSSPAMLIQGWRRTADGQRAAPLIEVRLREIALSGQEAARIMDVNPGNFSRRMQKHPDLRAEEGLTLPKLRKHQKQCPVRRKTERQPADKMKPTIQLEFADDGDEQSSHIHNVVSTFVLSRPATRGNPRSLSENFARYA